MLIVKDILLQLLIIMVPALLYKSIWLDRPKENRSQGTLLLTLLSSLSVLFCISFPIQVSGELQFDLRAIPLMGAILYGGIVPGIVTSAVMLLYRLYLGGDGIYISLMAFVTYASLTFMLMGRWNGLSLKRKLGYVALISLAYQIALLLAIILVYSLKDIPLETAVIRLESLSKFSIVAILAAVFYIYLLEFIRESILIRKQLVRAEKLKLISELAASVAHEVRNPLTVVRGFIQLMREDGNVTSREYMELVLSELDRAEYIISDYLSLAKPQAETSGKVGMAVTVTDVTALISSYAVIHKVEIQVNTEAGLYVCGNDVRIKQALLNLIKNAIESMPHGGILEIEARRSMDYVVIAIKDQGEGMTAAQIEKVGFPFYSTKEKGTGLGLMITSRIVEAMGGRLEFQSEAGKGTCVKVFLPAK